jgi:restriction system protein
MNGEDFEQYIGSLLRYRGFTVTFTRRSGDFGADIVTSKNGIRYSIQAKRRSRLIDRSAVADAVGAMAYYHYSRSMVIANSYLTEQAREFAKANHCQLIDRDTLADWLLAVSGDPPAEPVGSTSSEVG